VITTLNSFIFYEAVSVPKEEYHLVKKRLLIKSVALCTSPDNEKRLRFSVEVGRNALLLNTNNGFFNGIFPFFSKFCPKLNIAAARKNPDE